MTDTKETVNELEEYIEKAKRAFALKKYEQAVEFYASALDTLVKKQGEDSPEVADLYLAYGKALLENAISQTAVLGKQQTDNGLIKDEPDVGGSNGAKPFISFSGDAEESDEEDEEEGGPAEDVTVDLFAEAAAAAEAEEKEEEDDEDDDDPDAEPEDDFNAAWEVLDLARALYEKRKDEDEETKLKLADTYIALGDVSLETEKFDLAIPDYEAALALKAELLPLSSRQLAEAHYKLSIVLDLTSGRLSQAIEHAEKALDSVEARLAEMRNAQSGQVRPIPDSVKPVSKGKGKAKATPKILAPDELVQNMTKSQIEAEMKDLEGLREDLALKVEELKTSPGGEEATTNAPALAAKALDLELNGPSLKAEDPSKPVVINDLSTMVRKKKRPAPSDTEANGKRKAEDEAPAVEVKKARVEDEQPSS